MQSSFLHAGDYGNHTNIFVMPSSPEFQQLPNMYWITIEAKLALVDRRP